MSARTWPGPTDGSWSTSPTSSRPDFMRQGLHEGEHQRNIDHAGFVDDQQVAVERIIGVALEAALLGIGFEQPMDGLRLHAGLFGHALGGAAGRGGEQELRSLGGEDAQDRVEKRRLADAGAAGDHGDLGAQDHFHRLALRGGERLAGFLLDPGDGLVGVDLRPGRRAAAQGEKPVRDAPFGEMKAAQEDAVGPVDRVGDDLARLQAPRRGLVRSDRLATSRRSVDQTKEVVPRKAAMAVIRRLLQGERDAGAQPLRGLLGQAELHGDGVGGAEADAADVAGEPIGILGHHLDGVVAIGLEDPDRARRPDAMGMQKHHDVAHGLLFGPAGGDPRRAQFADAGNLAQAARLRLDDLEGCLAEDGRRSARRAWGRCRAPCRSRDISRSPPPSSAAWS